MKWLLPMCLIGALIGAFPGAVVAFFIAADTSIGSSGGEIICCLANLTLSICGAFVGMFSAKATRGQPRFQIVEVVLPIVLGFICGLTGYLWLD